MNKSIHTSFYVDGEPVSDTEARRRFRDGTPVELVNVSPNHYKSVLDRLGYTKVSAYDWTSSAGDWTLRIRGGYVFQENRYPYHGFRYTLERD